MLFSTLLLAGIASAAPALDARQVTTEFAPWEITEASSYRGGRPNSAPPSISISIKQPEYIRLQRASRGYGGLPAFEAECKWDWEKTTQLPVQRETLCTTVGYAEAYGNFTATVSGSNPGDFKVDFKETREIDIYGQKYVRVFEGQKTFNEDNSWTIRCSAGGACSWTFYNLQFPIKVKQALTKSIGSCEKATTGGC